MSVLKGRPGALLALVLGVTVLVAVGAPVMAAGPDVRWTRQFGSDKYDDVRGLAVDRRGNAYVAGSAEGPLPGQEHIAGADAFVRKVGPGGGALWTRQFGTSEEDRAIAAAVDGAGNVYVVGHTLGTLEGQPGGGSDAWVRKFGPGGTPLWTRQFGTTEDDEARGVAVDRDGNAYVVGQTDGDLQGDNIGDRDGFIRKFGPNGGVRWTRQFGTAGTEGVYGAAVDPDGFVYVAGDTTGVLQGGGEGDWDAWVRKYAPNGAHVRTRQFGTVEGDGAEGVATDGAGNVYVVGTTTGAFPGYTNEGFGDVFLRKLSPGGRHLWTRQFGTDQSDFGVSVHADPSGGAAVSGNTYAALPNQTHLDESDAFVRAYAASGKRRWTRQFGTTGNDGADGVRFDRSGNIIVAGSTTGDLQGENAGSWDAFVRKYVP